MQLFMQRLLVNTMVKQQQQQQDNGDDDHTETTKASSSCSCEEHSVMEEEEEQPKSSAQHSQQGVIQCQLDIVADNHRPHHRDSWNSRRAYSSDPHFELVTSNTDDEEEEEGNSITSYPPRMTRKASRRSSLPGSSSSSSRRSNSKSTSSSSNNNTYTSLHDHYRAAGLRGKGSKKNGKKMAKARVRTTEAFQPIINTSKMLLGGFAEEDEEHSERSLDNAMLLEQTTTSKKKKTTSDTRWTTGNSTSDAILQSPSLTLNRKKRNTAANGSIPSSPVSVTDDLATSSSHEPRSSSRSAPRRRGTRRVFSSDMILDFRTSGNVDRPPRRPRAPRRCVSSDIGEY